MENLSSVSSKGANSAPQLSKTNDTSSKRSRTWLIAFGLMVSLACGFLGGWWGSAGRDNTLTSGNTSVQRQVAASNSQLIAGIAKTVGPSVVSINVTTESAAAGFYGFAIPQQQQAAGTGIIISSEGLIITNRHVVPEGVTELSVTLSDGTKLDSVEVVGRTGQSDTLDVALLKVKDTKGHKLTPASIGDSGKVQVGDTVVAIGNALGQFQNTVTSGIISGFGRSVQAGDGSGGSLENLDDLFQTDAAINEGNSGGPLVNTAGEIIGINTAVSGSGQNIGFAIPIDNVSGLIKQVVSTGKFERPYLGVRYIALTADYAKELELDVDKGAYIPPAVDASQPSVIVDGPAAKAGIQEKDIITAINDSEVDSSHGVSSLLGRLAVGDKVRLSILRDGKKLTLTATLGKAPAN